MHRRRALAGRAVTALTLAAATAAGCSQPATVAPDASATTSPIKHVVVIFGENISFDHYFATYPHAANTPGETLQGSNRPAPTFTAAPETPTDIATLEQAGLLAPNNPNSVQPRRLTPGQAATCSQDHSYTAEQKAYNGGAMDRFVEFTSTDTCAAGLYGAKGLTMHYYDGNTVTALWNYAQHYAMSDHSFSTTFGPSTPGVINLVSGQTHGVTELTADGKRVVPTTSTYAVRSPDAHGVGTIINDPDPAYDDCSNNSHRGTSNLAAMTGRTVADLLGVKRVTWGWFQGGFTPTTAATGTTPAVCDGTHKNVVGAVVTDYSPHHNPFSYYEPLANPHHLAPASDAEIGHDGQARHQYDLSVFDSVVDTDRLPAVSFLKAPRYQDGHASYSDPLDEQQFIVREVNAIQRSRNWKDTAIIVAYDDSDGWYDHLPARVTNASTTADDAAICTAAAASGVPVEGGYQARCGPGPRQPLLVISPFARTNHVDHTQTDQASILRFIEDNWSTGQIGDHSADARAGSLSGLFDFQRAAAPQVLLDEATGTVTSVTKQSPSP